MPIKIIYATKQNYTNNPVAKPAKCLINCLHRIDRKVTFTDLILTVN